MRIMMRYCISPSHLLLFIACFLAFKPIFGISSYWEEEHYKEKIEKGEIVSISEVTDLPEEKKRLEVVSFGYVNHPRATLRRVTQDFDNLTKLSKNLKRTILLSKKKNEKVVYMESCLLWCAYHYEMVVLFKINIQDKMDQIAWEFISREAAEKRVGRSIDESKTQEFAYIGMHGDTKVLEVEPRKSLIILRGELISESSAFIRFFQKYILKTALTKTAYEMRENIDKLEINSENTK